MLNLLNALLETLIVLVDLTDLLDSLLADRVVCGVVVVALLGDGLDFL